jgi:hypothetical protein
LLPLLSLFAVASCDLQPEYLPIAQPERAAESPVASRFDPATCGRASGRVTWSGERPTLIPFIYGSPNPDGNFTLLMMSNPNAPAIDERTRGVARAVVFLRGIDPALAKPWDHPPARIELKDRGIRIVQGEASGRSGFVRRGDAVEMRSAEPVFHILRARGAAFFSLTFPEPDQPLSRSFDSLGRVELSSGAGYYWASADLFVVDHPYCVLTDSEGRYAFDHVPPGSFEVVAWHPNWDVLKQERDPESGLTFRQTYAKPREKSAKIRMEPGAAVEANFSLSAP